MWARHAAVEALGGSCHGASDRGPLSFRRVGQSVDLPVKARRWGHDLRGSPHGGCLKHRRPSAPGPRGPTSGSDPSGEGAQLDAVWDSPGSTGQSGHGVLWGTGSRLGSSGVRRAAAPRTGPAVRPHAGPGCDKPPGGAPKARPGRSEDRFRHGPVRCPLRAPSGAWGWAVIGRSDTLDHRIRNSRPRPELTPSALPCKGIHSPCDVRSGTMRGERRALFERSADTAIDHISAQAFGASVFRCSQSSSPCSAAPSPVI